MQSVSADLQAAILAQERQPLCRLRVDWDGDGNFTTVGSGYQDDISADVVSVETSNELATDIPAAAKLFSGSAAAQATIVLAHDDPGGDPAKHGGWFYSPLNSASPLFAKQRKGRPATLELGFRTAVGTDEYVTVLTGTVRSLTVTSGGRQAVMVLADRSETMRRQVTLPMVIADGDLTGASAVKRPGLNTTFLADWVARKCGYYASPPPRSGCLLSATMHGSGEPEVGRTQEHHGANGSKLSYSPTPTFPAAAKWVQAVNTDGSAGQEMDYILGGTGTTGPNNGQTLFLEGWYKFNSAAVDQPLFIAYNTGAATPFASVFYQGSVGGVLTATINRAGTDPTNRAATGPTISPGTSWHYYAVHYAFTSTGIDVTFRVDGTTTGPVHVAGSSSTSGANFDTVGIARGKVSAFAAGNLDGLTEAVQVTNEATAGSYNNAFVPTANIVPSSAIDNRLVATPLASEDGWTLFQRIAAAEFATAGFDELGVLYYWSRRRWTTAPYTTSQRTLTAATALKELASVEATDQVRNRVVIRATIPAVLDSSTVWKLASRVKIPASGSKTIWVSLNEPVGNVDTTIVSGTALGSSRYLAGTQLDGQGAQVTNLTFAVSVLSPTSIKIVITNPNAFVVYMAGDENASVTYSGKPYLWLDAQLVQFGNGDSPGGNSERAEATNATSITNYGEQLLEIEDSELRQDSDDIQAIADDLVVDLADPGPVLSDVPVVGDPRLQLGDRATITDPDGLGFSADFHCSAVNFSFDGEGLGMTLALRKA